MAAGQAKFGGGYDARNAECWNAAEAKATQIRLNWFQRNYDKLFADKKDEEIPYKAKELQRELTERQYARTGDEPRAVTRKTEFPPLPGADPSVRMRIMRPVDPEVRKIIYQGISKLDEGREKYLRRRCSDLIPEERYYFPETTSFLYGWQNAKLAPLMNNAARRGKVAVIKESFYSRTGAERENERNRQPFTSYCLLDSL